jgi:predicted transcriptional regulator
MSEQRMMSFQVPEKLARELRELASANDRSVSAETRRAIEVHLLLENRRANEVVGRRGRATTGGSGGAQ